MAQAAPEAEGSLMPGARRRVDKGKGDPRTGDGTNDRRKPKQDELRVLRKDGTMHARSQPPGWGAKILKFVRREDK